MHKHSRAMTQHTRTVDLDLDLATTWPYKAIGYRRAPLCPAHRGHVVASGVLQVVTCVNTG